MVHDGEQDWPLPSLLNQPLDGSSHAVGDTGWFQFPAKLGVKSAKTTASAATNRGILPPPLRSLAAAVQPHQIVVDCGGQGQCGPNTLAYLLSLVDLFNGPGEELRILVAAHAAQVLDKKTELISPRRPACPLTLRELIEDSVAAWPDGLRQGLPPTLETWLELVQRKECWTDIAFVQACADLFRVCFALTGVNDLGDVSSMFVVCPLNNVSPLAWLEVGCWLNRHFVAIVNVNPSEEAALVVAGAQFDGHIAEIEEWRIFDWPLSTSAEVARLLRCSHIRPTALVGMEFSGAVRLALEEQGVRALSVDFRRCDIGGMHFVGDVREVIDLQRWERIYLFPPFFQQLRGDDCLPYKIADGRAFWGVAMVLWCACTANGDSLLVEQPDTIVNDFIPLHLYPDVEVIDAHTSDFGDDFSKPVRLTCRNLQLQTPARVPAPPYEPNRGHSNHTSPEARDRARSSWAQFPRTSLAVASAPAKRPSPYIPPPLDYGAIITLFARSWAASGFPVPKDFRNPDAQPSSQEDRDYQRVRGVGDGREVDAVVNETDLLLPPQPHTANQRGGGQAAVSVPCDQSVDLTTSTPAVELEDDRPIPWVEEAPPDGSLGPCGDAPVDIPTGNRLRPLRFLRGLVNAAYVVILCLAARPLVFAHCQGCSLYGILPVSKLTNGALSKLVRKEVAGQWGATVPIFLAGEYAEGARLYVAAISIQESGLSKWGTPHSPSPSGFSWMSCDMLTNTPIADPVTRGVLAVSTWVRPMEEWTLAYDAVFRSGRTDPQEIISLYQERENAPPAWRVLHQSLIADRRLVEKLEGASRCSLLDEWVDVIRPLPLDALPADLITSLPSYEDSRLDQYPLPPIHEPYRTSPRPQQPPQPTPLDVPTGCLRPFDLYLPSGRGRLISWLEAQRRDLISIQKQLNTGTHPDGVDRSHRPEPIAIGQTEMQRWAQGIVWDCRRPCCSPLDHRVPTPSNLSLTFLQRELGAYPDRALLSHLLEGVSMEADVELQTVLVPHLTSLPKGFASVAKELRRLQKATWYDFFWEPPFVPFYLNGQGAVARKLEPDRFRRSTEGGGPRKPTFDASGLRAVSINFAARFDHIPQYLLADHRPDFLAWISKRGLSEALKRARQNLPSDPNVDPLLASAKFTKWPKEVKPTLAELMQALAVLKRAGALLGLDVYIFGDDLKDYFNQLRMQTADLWKLNVAFLEEPGDEVATNAMPPADTGPRLIFVSEKRLGFGTHPASNVAQRFSYALLDIFRAQMDEQESLHDEGSSQWKTMRHSMRDQCHNTSRYRHPATQGVLVCPQHRLYAAFMYTDDPVFLAVGAERAMRAITVWRQLVVDARLLTAIPEKRSLGSWTTWLGIVVVASLGIVFVPQNKLLRAMASVLRATHDKCEFHEYRALCGLLEHLRAVLLKGRGIMHGLYVPHSAQDASQGGPNERVTCTPLMRKQLLRWRTLITQAGGVSVKDSLLRRQMQPRPTLTVIFDSDACHGDANTPSGIGGYSHGLYWYFAVPLADYPWVNTPALEFTGVCFSIFMADHLFGDSDDGDVTILLRTDALTSALTLSRESQRSPLLVAAYQHLISTSEWVRISPRLRIQHIFGDANIMADAVSRAKWQQFNEFCALLRVTPRQLELHPEALNIFRHCRDLPRLHTSALTVCGALSRPPSPTISASPGLTRLRLASGSQMPSHSPSVAAAPSSLSAESSSPPSPALHKLRAVSAIASSNASPPQMAPKCMPSARVPPFRDSRPIHLRLPTATRQLPPSLQSSPLVHASAEYARRTASTFVGNGPMDFHVSAESAASLAQSLATNAATGINDNTHSIDARAWSMWETVCSWYQTSPYRSEADVRDNPQRNHLLLVTLMLYAFASCTPRTASASFIKPNSALAYPLAIIRVFGRWGVPMQVKALKATLHQLSRYYLQLHGQYSLVPRRAEPMKYSMVLRINRIPSSAVIDGLLWSDTIHDVFMFRRLNLVIWPTGCRLAEFVGGSELTCFTFESLTWSIGGVVIVTPTPQQLRSLRPNVDFARLTPPRSKPDQFGETHCPFPIVLMFELCEGNAAAALRDLELQCAPPSSSRPTTPLFHTSSGAPYTHARLDRLFKAVLTHCFGAAVASAYSWHSYRSGLATALHAAGVDDARIQLICRWLCPASLLVYRRMGSAEYSQLTSAAMRTHVDALQSQNIMRLADSPEYADILAHPVKAVSYDIAAQNHSLVRSAATLTPTRAHERAAPVVSNDKFYANFFATVAEWPDIDAVEDVTRPSTSGLRATPRAARARTTTRSAAPAHRAVRRRARAAPARAGAEDSDGGHGMMHPIAHGSRTTRLAPAPPRAATPARLTARRRRRSAPPEAPSTDAETTTGVGALHFQFPDDLSAYQTYNERQSKRHAPTSRYGPTHRAL